jgi:hypothetical protein
MMISIIDLFQKTRQLKVKTMEKSIRILHWAPRILCIAAILFVSLFALDAFEPGLPLGDQVKGFLIHMIPSFILLAILLLAWKWELTGGILFILIGLVTTPVIFSGNYRVNESIWLSVVIVLTITIPLLVVGILFVLSHHRKNALKS